MKANQEEKSMHEAEEDAKESPFAAILIDATLFEYGKGFGVPGKCGEPGDGRDL